MVAVGGVGGGGRKWIPSGPYSQGPLNGPSHSGENDLISKLNRLGLNGHMSTITDQSGDAKQKVSALASICTTLLEKLDTGVANSNAETARLKGRLNRLLALCDNIANGRELKPGNMPYFNTNLTGHPKESQSPFLSDIKELVDATEKCRQPSTVDEWAAVWTAHESTRMLKNLGGRTVDWNTLWNDMFEHAPTLDAQTKVQLVKCAFNNGTLPQTLTTFLQQKLSQTVSTDSNATPMSDKEFKLTLLKHGMIQPRDTQTFDAAAAIQYCMTNEGARESLGIVALMMATPRPLDNTNINQLLQIRGAPGGEREASELVLLTGSWSGLSVTFNTDIRTYLDKRMTTTSPYERPPLLNDNDVQQVVGAMANNDDAQEMFRCIDPLAFEQMSQVNQADLKELEANTKIAQFRLKETKTFTTTFFEIWKNYAKEEAENAKKLQRMKTKNEKKALTHAFKVLKDNSTKQHKLKELNKRKAQAKLSKAFRDWNAQTKQSKTEKEALKDLQAIFADIQNPPQDPPNWSAQVRQKQQAADQKITAALAQLQTTTELKEVVSWADLHSRSRGWILCMEGGGLDGSV